MSKDKGQGRMWRGCNTRSHWVWLGKRGRSGGKHGNISGGQIAVAKETGQWRRVTEGSGRV